MADVAHTVTAVRTGITRHHITLNILAFAGTAASAMLFHWQTRDVIWGLWASSLCVGYAFIVMSIVVPIVSESGWTRVAMAIGAPFALAFFSVHFGGFHLGHAVFLNVFFPLEENMASEPASIPHAAYLIFSSYWPFVAMTFVSRFSDFRAIKTDWKNSNLMMKPYINVIRMHVLIFVFAGLHAAKLSEYTIYPVLVAYFFPWGALFAGRMKANRVGPTQHLQNQQLSNTRQLKA